MSGDTAGTAVETGARQMSFGKFFKHLSPAKHVHGSHSSSGGHRRRGSSSDHRRRHSSSDHRRRRHSSSDHRSYRRRSHS
ncbi:hypothetical protein GCM10009533_23230 [Saccharopolyspora spinosporotrichia]|nr:hypothetical protein N599_08415 [Saccharopolyspora erythraea D]